MGNLPSPQWKVCRAVYRTNVSAIRQPMSEMSLFMEDRSMIARQGQDTDRFTSQSH